MLCCKLLSHVLSAAHAVCILVRAPLHHTRCVYVVWERERKRQCVSLLVLISCLSLSFSSPYCSLLSDLQYTMLSACKGIRMSLCLWASAVVASHSCTSCLCIWAPVTLATAVCCIVWFTENALSRCCLPPSLWLLFPLAKLRDSNSLGLQASRLVFTAYFGGRVEKLGLVQLTVWLCYSPAFKGWSSLFFNQRSGFVSVITHWHSLCWHLLLWSNL